MVLNSQESNHQTIYLSSSLDFFRILPDVRYCISGKGKAEFLSRYANSSVSESSLSSEETAGRFPATTAKSDSASWVTCVVTAVASVSRCISTPSSVSLIASEQVIWTSSSSDEATISSSERYFWRINRYSSLVSNLVIYIYNMISRTVSGFNEPRR